MYIEPNSTVKLLKDVPLDASEDHTIWFDTREQQVAWFNGYVKTGMIFERQYYQRFSKNEIKLEVLADNIFDCNYMMFLNTNFGSKWFFAYITNIEYVSNTVAKISYSIDDLQTWHFDFTLGQCFVEREHADSDDIGDNLIPENLPTGEVQYASEEYLLHYDPQWGGSVEQEYMPCVVVAAPFDKNGDNSYGTLTSGMYSGLYYNIFYRYYDETQQRFLSIEEQLVAFFNKPRVAARVNEVVTMFYYFVPFARQGNSGFEPNHSWTIKSKTVVRDFNGFKNDYTDNLEEAYIPKNNKLFTAPYNYLTLTDFKGNTVDYMYEFFNSPTCKFLIAGGLSAQPAICFAPCEYMGNGGYDVNLYNANLDYAYWYKDFPRVPWNTDGFIAYLAQASVAFLGRTSVDIAGAAIAGVAGAAVSGDVAAINKANKGAATLNTPASALSQGQLWGYKEITAPSADLSIVASSNDIKSIMAGAALAAYRGTIVQGKMYSVDNWSIGDIRVSAIHKKIRKEYAQMIDEYFTMFGYATYKVKVPNRHVRQCFTYTKTVNCVLNRSEMPADAAKHICDIFNRGITYWDRNATVGDYTQTNTPIQ